MSHHPPPAGAQPERFGRGLLETAAALATIFSFLGGLIHLVPFLGKSPDETPVTVDVLRLVSGPGTTAVLLISLPIFTILNTFLVISIAKAALSLLRRCGVEVDSDFGAWLLLLFVLLPVAAGTTLAFLIVLFGEVLSAFSLVCVAGSVLVTGYFAFRGLQKALF